ncbi:unnamed protein product [Closterium sp. Naga37s-1]|nr:unnamed protein product [Closterium sp. Naga37s-1]
MELLRDSDDWADVEPLPQDDGPDPVVPIAYSREFDDAMGFMRAVLASGERSARVLRLTERVISVNAASYTAWQLRRDVLTHLLSLAEPEATTSKPSSTSADENRGDEGDWLVQDEVLYAENVTLSNPKNYQVWHHRRWLASLRKDRVTRRQEQMEQHQQQQQQQEQECVSNSPSPLQQVPLRSITEVAQEEFRFCEEALRGDSKNYHAWCHRQWVAREFDTWHGELTFCEKLLDDDVRNNSAWNHRMFVLEHLIAKQKQGAEHVGGGANQEKDSEIRVTPVTVEDEVTFAVTAIWLAPSNESPWRYLQGLIRLLEKEAEGVGKEGDLRLLGICMDVLASEPECVHALATLLSVLGRGCMSDKVGKVLGLSQDGAGDSAAISCTDAAVALCEKLQKSYGVGNQKLWLLRNSGAKCDRMSGTRCGLVVAGGATGVDRRLRSGGLRDAHGTAPYKRDARTQRGAAAVDARAGQVPVPATPVGGYWAEGESGERQEESWVGKGRGKVRGSDAANLAATRQAQAEIWRHQFPNESPSAAKSAAATSSAATSSAATSSAATSAAAASSFQSESNPVASTSACSGRRLFVMDWPKRKHGIGSQLSIMSAYLSLALTHNRTLVPTPGTYIRANHSECLEAGNLNSFDCYFFPLVAKSCALMVHWWRAQSLRFMLRWPSAYLCHVSNRVRQQAYGLHVAVRIEESRAAQKKILDSLGPAAAAVDDDNNEAGGKDRYEKEGEEGEGEEEVYRRVGGEVYMPRPVVSVHVRQGDKQKEMRLSSFRSYMLHVQRLRLRVPDVHYVWLSTEMQTVIDELESYNDWTFLYSKNKRQLGSTQMLEYERAAGLEQLVGVSFASRPSAALSHAPFLPGVPLLGLPYFALASPHPCSPLRTVGY